MVPEEGGGWERKAVRGGGCGGREGWLSGGKYEVYCKRCLYNKTLENI